MGGHGPSGHHDPPEEHGGGWFDWFPWNRGKKAHDHGGHRPAARVRQRDQQLLSAAEEEAVRILARQRARELSAEEKAREHGQHAAQPTRSPFYPLQTVGLWALATWLTHLLNVSAGFDIPFVNVHFPIPILGTLCLAIVTMITVIVKTLANGLKSVKDIGIVGTIVGGALHGAGLIAAVVILLIITVLAMTLNIVIPAPFNFWNTLGDFILAGVFIYIVRR